MRPSVMTEGPSLSRWELSLKRWRLPVLLALRWARMDQRWLFWLWLNLLMLLMPFVTYEGSIPMLRLSAGSALATT